MPNTRLYRQAALDKLSRPDQLDQLLQVTSLRGWIALFGLIAVLVAVTLWGFFGTIPTILNASGVIIRQGGTVEIQSQTSGQLTSLNLKVGDKVITGQVVAQLKTEQGQEISITSPTEGKVLDVPVNVGTALKPGTLLTTLDPTEQPLEGLLLVPLGQSLRVGQRVELTPANSGGEYLRGTVSYISDLPVSAEELNRRLNNTQLAQAFASGSPALEVIVKLETDKTDSHQYQWSSKPASTPSLNPGTLCAARLILSERKPVSLIFAGVN